jgi:hypothetical protein
METSLHVEIVMIVEIEKVVTEGGGNNRIGGAGAQERDNY